MKRSLALFLGIALVVGFGVAAELDSICGSHPGGAEEALALHRAARSSAAGPARLALGSASTNIDFGEIAVIEDFDGVVARSNDFDLEGLTVAFEPVSLDASSYRFETSDGGYDAAAAAAGSLIAELGDDDTRLVAMPFSFPFYGEEYESVYINSDGNLTFNESDTSISERSLGRVISGPPRIAPLFRDLDPTSSQDGVRVLSEPSRFVVSWVGVPEWLTYGTGSPKTFQLRMYPDGRIEFSFQSFDTSSAVVGIAPGASDGETRVVSFAAGSDEEFDAAVAERFTTLNEVDIVRTAQKFYETHDDAYDYLVIYNTVGVPAGSSGTVAYEVTLRNHRSGYGDFQVDIGAEAGSPRRLQAILNMGPLSQYPSDPDGIVAMRAQSRDTPLTILGHEAGHLFLAFASVRDEDDPEARPMLGRGLTHWSFLFNSEASLLEGNRICDTELAGCPDATDSGRFVTTATVEGFSALDQYLMGFLAPDEVPPTFLVEDNFSISPAWAPQSRVSFNGTRRDIVIDEIIAAEGRRTPDHTVSQRHFRFAFIMIVAAGTQAQPDLWQKLDRFRTGFDLFYSQATGDRAWADTTLRRELRLSTFPGSGVTLGTSMRAQVAVAEPAEGDLEVLLAPETGAIGVPGSVTIPSGQTSAEFEIAGLAIGPDRLSAEIPGLGYMLATSPIQVLGAASDLRLELVSGDRQEGQPGAPLPQPVVVRVSDINNLPYPGVGLLTTVTGGGSVEPVEPVTDENGEARLTWTLGVGGGNILTTLIDGADPAVAVAATALGRPYFTSAGVVNGASFQPALSPGSFASLYGINLSGGVVAEGGYALPTQLAGVRVLMNGVAARLHYVSDWQINFIVPDSIASGVATVVVTNSLGESDTVIVNVQPVSPAVFALPGGMAAVNYMSYGDDDYLEIYCTGLGAVEFNPATGFNETLTRPQVWVGESPAEVLYSGLAYGWFDRFGLYQVNIRIPPGLAPGQYLLRLEIAGVAATPVAVLR